MLPAIDLLVSDLIVDYGDLIVDYGYATKQISP